MEKAAVWKEGIRVVCFSFSFRIFPSSFVSHCCGNLGEIVFLHPANHKGKNARGYSVSLKDQCHVWKLFYRHSCVPWLGHRDCVELEQGWYVWVIQPKQFLQSKYCLVFQVVIAWTNRGRFLLGGGLGSGGWKSLPENLKDSILKLADSGVSTLQILSESRQWPFSHIILYLPLHSMQKN